MGASPERSASQRIEVVHLKVYSHDSGLCARDATAIGAEAGERVSRVWN